VLVPSEVLVTADSMVGVEANEEALKNGQQWNLFASLRL
jgi:hypothetical protein